MNPLNIFRKAKTSSLGTDETQWLAQQKKKYPYFSLLHFVEAKQAIQSKSKDGEVLRAIASLYAQDRRRFAGYVEDRFHVNTSSVATLFKGQIEPPKQPQAKIVETKTSKKEPDTITPPTGKVDSKVTGVNSEANQPATTDTQSEPKKETKPEVQQAREVKNPVPKPKPVSSLKIERIGSDTATAKPHVVTDVKSRDEPSDTPIPKEAPKAVPQSTAAGTIDQGLQTKIMLRSSMIQNKATVIKKELAQFKGSPLFAVELPSPEPKREKKSEVKPEVIVSAPKAVPPETKKEAERTLEKPVDAKPSKEVEVKKVEHTPQAPAEKVEEPKPVLVADVKHIAEASALPIEQKPAPAVPTETLKEVEEQPRPAGRRTQPSQGLGFNSPEQDASFDSLRRSLLELIHTQIGDVTTAKTTSGSPLINDPGKALHEQETVTPSAKLEKSLTVDSQDLSVPMLSAEPDATQVEMQQLDDLRSRLKKMNVLHGDEGVGQTIEEPRPSVPETVAAPVEAVAPATPKRERVVGEKLGGTDSLRRFVDLALIEASTISTATGTSIEPLVGGDMRAFRSTADPAAVKMKPRPQKEEAKPAEPPSSMVVQRVEKAAEELKQEIGDKHKPKPQFEGQSSMQRFVSPSFEVLPVGNVEATKPAVVESKSDVPRTVSEQEGQEALSIQASSPSLPKSNEHYEGSASLNRFVSPSFEPVPPTLQVDLVPDAHPIHTLETPAENLPGAEIRPTARAQAADKARAAVEGENSMKRFVSPSFEAVPASLQVDIAADKTATAIKQAATEVTSTTAELKSPKSVNAAVQAIEPPPKPVLTGDELTLSKLPTNPFMTEEERQAKKNSMMRFVMPSFDGKSETLHLEREGTAEVTPAERVAGAPLTTQTDAVLTIKEPVADAKTTENIGGTMRRFVGLDDTLSIEQQKRNEEVKPVAEKKVPEAVPIVQQVKPDDSGKVIAPKAEPVLQAESSTFRKFVGPTFDIEGKVRLSVPQKEGDEQPPLPKPVSDSKHAIDTKSGISVISEPVIEKTVSAKEEKQQVETPKVNQPLPTHIDFQHRDLQVEIVLKPEQLKYFKHDPVKLQQVAAKADTDVPSVADEGATKLRNLMEQEAFLRVEREFVQPKPIAKQAIATPPQVEIDSPLPEQLEELQQSMMAGAGYPIPAASDLAPLQPNAFDARISNFRENLERLRTRGMPVIPEVSAKAIQRKFLDQVVRAMSSSATVSIEAAPIAGYDVAVAVAQAPVIEANSKVDKALAQIGKLESAIASNLEAVRQNPAAIPDEQVHPAVQANEYEGEAISETLAQIHILQGRPDKAMQVYEQLSLKFPEKSGYFASLIKNLSH